MIVAEVSMRKPKLIFFLLIFFLLKSQSGLAIERDYRFCRQTIESVAKEFEIPFHFQPNTDILQGHNGTRDSGSKTYIKRIALGTENPSGTSLKLTEKDGILAEYEIVQKDKCLSGFTGWSCRDTKLHFEVTVDPVTSKCAFKSMTVKQSGSEAETIHRTLMNTRICDALRGLNQDELNGFQTSKENENGKWKARYGLIMQGGKRSRQKDGIAIKHFQNKCGEWIEDYGKQKGPAKPGHETTT
jgi:hypothetical protein